MKRTLPLLLTLCMLISLFAIPVSAYTSSTSSRYPTNWVAAVDATFADASAAPLADFSISHLKNGTTDNESIVSSLSLARGMWRLYNSTTISSDTGYSYLTGTAEQYASDNSNIGLVTTAGSTIDLAVKFSSLPEIGDDLLPIAADGSYTPNGSAKLTDLGQNTGFILRVKSRSDYINLDGTPNIHTGGTNKNKPRSTEYIISFVKYDNPVLGTNAAIIFKTGAATTWTTADAGSREVYFCNLDLGSSAQYHRYTFSTDYSKAVVGNTDDLVTLYIDGERATTFSIPARNNYSAACKDTLTMGLYINQFTEGAKSEEGFDAQVDVDQLSVYGTPLTPASDTPSDFVEVAPLQTEAFEDALNKAESLTEEDYSKKTWSALAALVAEAKALGPIADMTPETITQEELNELTEKLNAAIAALRYNDFNSVVEEKRLYIGHSFFNATDTTGYPYVWTNGSLIFTDPNYDIGQYRSGSGQTSDLASFSSAVFAPTEVEGEYKVVAKYRTGTSMANRAMNKAPVGGFVIYTHANTVGTSTSRYASQLFGDDNIPIMNGIKVGDIARLENVTLYSDKAAGLQTSGSWYSRYDPKVVDGTYDVTNSGSTCDAILTRYPCAQAVTWRDHFEDFSSTSAVVMIQAIGAHLDEYYEITGKIAAANPDDYTKDSWAALEAVAAEVDLEREDLTQDDIDAWTDALNEAYDALVLAGAGSGDADDPNNPNKGEDTGDTGKVFLVLGIVALLAIGCAVTLVIGRRRGNF